MIRKALIGWVTALMMGFHPVEEECEHCRSELILEEARRVAGFSACRNSRIVRAPGISRVEIEFETYEDACDFSNALKRLVKNVTEEE